MAAAAKQNNVEVVVVGSCNTDFFFFTDAMPKTGETVTGKRLMKSFGGKGANQCIAAAKLGGKVSIIARVGDDFYGEEYIEYLNKEGVDTTHVLTTSGTTTGSAQITVDQEGRSVIIINAGANAALTPKDVEAAKSVIERAKVLLLQLEVPVETSIAAMKLCKGTIIMNAAPAIHNYDKDILKLPTIFCVNEIEAESFSGMPSETIGDAMKASEKLLSMGCRSVVITLGEFGCVYADGRDPPEHYVPPKVTAVDNTGAGDAFLGSLGFMLSREKNYGMERSLQVACAVGASCVTKAGAHSGFADASFLKQFNITQ